MILYHGTSREAAIAIGRGGWRDGDVYLTRSRREAFGFAARLHLGGSPGRPIVLRIRLAPGRTLLAHDEVDRAIMEGYDLDPLMADARRRGFRYVRFFHPSFFSEKNHIVYVSLHPREDLEVIGLGRQ